MKMIKNEYMDVITKAVFRCGGCDEKFIIEKHGHFTVYGDLYNFFAREISSDGWETDEQGRIYCPKCAGV